MSERKRRPDGVFVEEAAALARAAGLKRYLSARPCPSGHVGERFVSNYGCVECLRLHARKYYAKNLERMRKRSSEWVKRNPERHAARMRKWYHASPENKAERRRQQDEWRRKNPEAFRLQARLQSQRRRARFCMPLWADANAIRRIYAECPAGMEVDHIVPILGKFVCGLHVETNLQYLTKSENSSKGAKWPM